MTGGRWLSPFAPPPSTAAQPAPDPAPPRVPEPPFVPELTIHHNVGGERVPLAEQIAVYLKQEMGSMPNLQLAKATGLTPNTVVRSLSGVGLKLSTLEKIAAVQGWHIEIRNAAGDVFARY